MDLTLLEPESDLLLGVLNTVRTMANIPSNIYGIVPCVLRQYIDVKHEEEEEEEEGGREREGGGGGGGGRGRRRRTDLG